VPEVQNYEKSNNLINAMHVRFSHASVGELKRILKLKLKDFEQIKPADIDHWYQENGIKSSKPLVTDKPGVVTTREIMFIEGTKDIKKPLLI
jgi:hypothetical protein